VLPKLFAAPRSASASRATTRLWTNPSDLAIALESQVVPSAPVYYQPREQLGPRIVLTLPVGVVLGIAYGFVSCLVTQVFEQSALFIVVTPLFGGAIAASSRWVANRAQVRSLRFRLALAVAMSAIALYVGWQAYLVLADLRIFDFTPTWTMSPAKLVRGLVELADNNHGLWSWVCWIVEAATVFSMVVYLMHEVDIEVPFCEECHAWTKVVVSFELSNDDIGAAEERLRAGDAAALAAMRPRPQGADEYGVVRVYSCTCGNSRYVSLDHEHREAGKSAGLRTYTIGSRPSLYFDPGSSATTDLIPVVTNLEIDELTEQVLTTARAELANRQHSSTS
jgi:hypothetical protein